MFSRFDFKFTKKGGNSERELATRAQLSNNGLGALIYRRNKVSEEMIFLAGNYHRLRGRSSSPSFCCFLLKDILGSASWDHGLQWKPQVQVPVNNRRNLGEEIVYKLVLQLE